MRRLLIPVAVAAMVFAMSAFAATFSLNDSVLAVGEADVSDCGDVRVESWGLETNTGAVNFVRLAVDEECYGGDKVLFAVALDSDGNKIQRSGEHALGVTPQANEMVHFQNPVPVAPIEGLRVFIHTKE